jgi:hypothetical protein
LKKFAGPKSDRMCQFLGSETDIMGDRYYIKVIDSTRVLGTIIPSDFRWDLNTMNSVKKANDRMELLRKVAGFWASEEDLTTICILFVRSISKQFSPVWHSSLTDENSNDLGRVQKSSVKIILGAKYLAKLHMIILKDSREQLCLSVAEKCVRKPKTSWDWANNSVSVPAHPLCCEQWILGYPNLCVSILYALYRCEINLS